MCNDNALPAFREGLPVKIQRWRKTLILDSSLVRVRYEGAAAFTEKPARFSLSEFKSVELLKQTMRMPRTSELKILVSVRLLHSHDPDRTLTLASREWGEGDYAPHRAEPLRRVWHEAAVALALPAEARFSS